MTHNHLPSVVQARLQEWHRAVFSGDGDALRGLLDTNVVFHTPLYLKPRRGAAVVALILEAAFSNFGDFRYHRETVSADHLVWILEFEV
jgi:hypothetical protein